MKQILFIIIIYLIVVKISFSQSFNVVESTAEHIKIEFNFENCYSVIDTVIDGRTFQYIRGKSEPILTAGEPLVPAYYINIGVPTYSAPQVKIISVTKSIYENKFILPMPKEDSVEKPLSIKNLNEKIYGTNKFFPAEAASIIDDYFYRFARIIILNGSPFQFNPVTKELIFNKKIIVEVDFGGTSEATLQSFNKVNDPSTNEFLKSTVVNKKEALGWEGELKTLTMNKSLSTQGYWYNPQKNYYKIYVKNKGIYRITYDQLAADGVQMNNVPLSKLELFNNGVEIPLYIYDSNKDGIFNTGDYFEFVGYPPPPTPYCALNIYNNDNVYFFSTQADSSGLRYLIKDGYPSSYDYTYQTNYTKLHFEKDSLFENLGYAGDDHRDFWMWDNVSGSGGSVIHQFQAGFNTLQDFNPDSTNVTIRVKMQGLTENSGCYIDHRAYISLTDQPLGELSWAGQNTATFETTIKVSNNDFKIYSSGNNIQVKVTGDACPISGSDEIAVNWFEIEYWRDNRADTNHIEFSSPPNVTGEIRYWTWRFIRDSILVFIPQKNELITDAQVTHDQDNSIFFEDSVSSPVDYFCGGYDYYLTPDSIIKSEQSDLRNTSNGADYIIITHPDLKPVAERLTNFRQTNFPDSTIPNPRIKIVYVNQIYNEFSNGLLDPFALQKFLQYTFYNWQKPAPAYVVLIGDMSHDFRHLLTTSMPSFVPSIPFYTNTYGEGFSDNNMVAVSGNDVHPDMAIGRISCETAAEGNVQVDKLISYPADNTKAWKQNVLLLSSGLSQEDEDELGLNDASVELEQDYLSPNGINSSKVMRYPNRPEYEQYQGGGPEIRDQFNKGAILVNYYGHGGGYQWDLTFTNDDIYLLNNGGKLPLVLSLTCYTAHFDDQDVFGEQFNSVPGKGSIGFFGNFGLTYWRIGTELDDIIFDQIFNKHNYIAGKVFQFMKNAVPATGYYPSQITLLTYLGDPLLKLALPNKPDFAVTPSDISFGKDNTTVNDTLNVKVKIQNLGIIFPGDSVTVQLFVQAPDTSYQLPELKLGSFGIEDSIYFTWIPNKADLYTVTAKVNAVNVIPEMDNSDNTASTTFSVYNLNNPNLISPVDGYSSQNNFIDFRIADIGYYINHPLKYYIEIDTNLNFNNPITSPELSGIDGLVTWRAINLRKGDYFWRSRIFDGKDSSGWSFPRTFSIINYGQTGYLVAGKQMQMFNYYNMNISDSGLVLNSNYLPPRPSNSTYLGDIIASDTTMLDSVAMTAITTDGKFIYFGFIWYYALSNNSGGCTKIYKIGTGFSGTVKGQYYGTIPNFFAPIRDEMFYYHDGYIYAATGDPYSLLRIDRSTGDTSRIHIPQGMLRLNDGKVQIGSFYLAADSNYVYNISLGDSTGDNHYISRTFDPSKNWALEKPDMKLSSTSYQGFASFFAADGYLYPYENYESGFMRRIRISDGVFEEEWISYLPFQGYYAWCYDLTNNLIYASVYRKGYKSRISVFKGRYLDASGLVTTNNIGPASKWNSLNYSVLNNSPSAIHKASLFGENTFTRQWDTLNVNLPSTFSLSNIDTKKYSYLKMNFNFLDSSFTVSSPIILKSVSVNYASLPDISLSNTDLTINPDSVLQGLPVNVKLKIHNNGLTSADSAIVNLTLNSTTSPFYSKVFSLPGDSTVEFNSTVQTADLSVYNNVSAVVNYKGSEFYSFNNQAENNFFIARDSTNPTLSVTFDGKNIYNGDIISPKPKILITLKDNSPLPLDTTDFSIVVDNSPLVFSNPDVKFSYAPYPNSQAVVNWTPKFADGKHSLDVLAKDQSGNYSDSSAQHFDFYVYNQDDIIDLYNYPDPFKSDTYFTFQLTGDRVPDELRIKIYTVVGRLIRNITVPTYKLQIGFNRIYWDGRDQDGDDVANGAYLYQVVYKNGTVQKSVIQKMARVR